MDPYGHPRVGDNVFVPGRVIDVGDDDGQLLVEVADVAVHVPANQARHAPGGWRPPDFETKATWPVGGCIKVTESVDSEVHRESDPVRGDHHQ